MSYMNQAAFAPAGGIQELSFDEIDEVSGGALFVPALIFLGKAAAAGIAGTVAVGFVDGLIEGFSDEK